MKRIVERELLDDLADDDPRAIASRRDIARLNRVMGNGSILGDLLRRGMSRRKPLRIVELGAGDGTLMLELARTIASEWQNVELALVDQKSTVSNGTREGFRALGWRAEVAVADVFDWLEKSDAKVDVIVANLFLHHFPEKQLTRLLALAAARCEVFAACEPRRAYVPAIFSRLAGLIGCNGVTRHDAVVSVRAGFAGKELSGLWPAEEKWRLEEHEAGRFMQAFLARRSDAA